MEKITKMVESELNSYLWLNLEKSDSGRLMIRFKDQANGAESQECKTFIAKLFDAIKPQQYKIKFLAFNFTNTEGKIFNFKLPITADTWPCVAKNGSISLYLSREEFYEFKMQSGQTSNREQRQAIYAFDPENPQDSNYTIFYTRNLSSCIIDNL